MKMQFQNASRISLAVSLLLCPLAPCLAQGGLYSPSDITANPFEHKPRVTQSAGDIKQKMQQMAREVKERQMQMSDRMMPSEKAGSVSRLQLQKRGVWTPPVQQSGAPESTAVSGWTARIPKPMAPPTPPQVTGQPMANSLRTGMVHNAPMSPAVRMPARMNMPNGIARMPSPPMAPIGPGPSAAPASNAAMWQWKRARPAGAMPTGAASGFGIPPGASNILSIYNNKNSIYNNKNN